MSNHFYLSSATDLRVALSMYDMAVVYPDDRTTIENELLAKLTQAYVERHVLLLALRACHACCVARDTK
jgi:hypothetical protein